MSLPQETPLAQPCPVAVATHFACSRCHKKFSCGQASPLCSQCLTPRPPEISDPLCQESVPPEWARSLSQAVGDLSRLSQAMVTAIERLPSQLSAQTGPSHGPSQPATRDPSRKRARTSSARSHSSDGTSDMSPDRSVTGAGASLQDPTPSSGDPSDSDSESERDANLASAMQALIRAVRDSLHIQDESSSPSQDEVSFRRNRRQPLVFPNHGEFYELVLKEWKHPTRRSHTPKKFDVLFPFSEELVSRWSTAPNVDPPVSRLSKNTTIPLPDGASLSDPVDKQVDSLSKSVFMAAGALLRPAFASSWVSKACTVWARQLLQGLSSGVSQEDLTELASQLLHASKFLCEASLESARLAARATANSVAMRRSVWLKSWMADSASKKALTNLAFSGGRLFGKRLDEIISEATGGRSSLLPQNRPKRKPQSSRQQRFRSFRDFNFQRSDRKTQKPSGA